MDSEIFHEVLGSLRDRSHRAGRSWFGLSGRLLCGDSFATFHAASSGKKVVDLVDRVVGDTSDDVGEPGFRIDVVERAVSISLYMIAALRRSQPTESFSAQCKGPDGSFSGVVRHFETPVIHVAGQGRPTRGRIADGLAEVALALILASVSSRNARSHPEWDSPPGGALRGGAHSAHAQSQMVLSARLGREDRQTSWSGARPCGGNAQTRRHSASHVGGRSRVPLRQSPGRDNRRRMKLK
jgi:hypothetical protein